MGFFWDLLQQYQIGQTNKTSGSMEQRIDRLERDLQVSYQIIEQMAQRLDELDASLETALPQADASEPNQSA